MATVHDLPQLDVDPATILTDEERQPCEVWTRVMGYHRPISAYNPGKRQEAKDRKYYKI